MRSVWMPTPTAAPVEAKAKDRFPGRRAPWAGRVGGWWAASLLGGMKQPRISVGSAKCGSSSQSVSSNCSGSQGAWCQVQH